MLKAPLLSSLPYLFFSLSFSLSRMPLYPRLPFSTGAIDLDWSGKQSRVEEDCKIQSQECDIVAISPHGDDESSFFPESRLLWHMGGDGGKNSPM
jgi:hypothetical protein